MNWLTKWAGGGAVGTVLAGTGAEAYACHETLSQGYLDSPNVGLSVGISFAPRIRFIWGVDLRLGTGHAVGFARLEGHGLLVPQPRAARAGGALRRPPSSASLRRPGLTAASAKGRRPAQLQLPSPKRTHPRPGRPRRSSPATS